MSQDVRVDLCLSSPTRRRETLCRDWWVRLRKTRPLGGWIVGYPFLLEVLWGGDTAGRWRTFGNGCPGEFWSFSYTSLISYLSRGDKGIPPTASGGDEFVGAPKRKMPVEQGIFSFTSFKPFALILPSPCNASANQSHFHSIRGRAQILASQLMQSSCS